MDIFSLVQDRYLKSQQWQTNQNTSTTAAAATATTGAARVTTAIINCAYFFIFHLVTSLIQSCAFQCLKVNLTNISLPPIFC